jgi:hypothetical protein
MTIEISERVLKSRRKLCCLIEKVQSRRAKRPPMIGVRSDGLLVRPFAFIQLDRNGVVVHP